MNHDEWKGKYRPDLIAELEACYISRDEWKAKAEKLLEEVVAEVDAREKAEKQRDELAETVRHLKEIMGMR